MGRWSRRWSPKYWPTWYRILFGCCIAVMLLGGVLAWFGGPWLYTNLVGVILVGICILILQMGPDDFDADD